MKGAFVLVFVFFLIIAFVGISLPIANWIVQEYIADILPTDYASLVEGLINGAIYGFIAWIIFAVVKTFYKQAPKERVVKAKSKTVA